MADHFIPTDNEQLETSPTPRYESAPDAEPWWEGPASAWPQSALTTTTVEQVMREAELQAAQRDDKLDELPLDDFEDMDDDEEKGERSAANDADLNVMDFYNGRNFSAGRALHNQARIARGLAPIPEGKR